MKANNKTDELVPTEQISVFHGRHEHADYRRAPISLYRGNPLVEALPSILTPKEARKLMARYPDYDPADRTAPAELRIHQMHTALNLFVPLPEHDSLEQRFSCLIRVGYVPRNPMQAGYWVNIDKRVKSLNGSIPIIPRSSSTGMSIIGTSGGGKTTSVETVLQLYPQAIFHSQYDERKFTSVQLVWLKMSCPHNGSVRALCVNFFNMIDEILGTNYHRAYAKGRGNSVDEMLPHMARVAATHHLGVLVIDEIQHLNQSKCGGKEQMLNFFCELVNRIGLPVVFIGTYKAMPLLTEEFRQLRRGCGQGDFVWDRMTRGAKWNYFLETLWKYQYTAVPTPLTPELNEAIFDETQGITDFAVKLYLLAQVRTIRTASSRQAEVITPAIVHSVALDSLRTAQPVIKALRHNDHASLSRFSDVQPLDFSACVQQVIESTREDKRAKAGAKRPDVRPASSERQASSTSNMKVEPIVPDSDEIIVDVAKSTSRDKGGAYAALQAAGIVRKASDLLQEEL